MNIFSILGIIGNKLFGSPKNRASELDPIPIPPAKAREPNSNPDVSRYDTKWYDVDLNLANPNYKPKVVAPRPPPMQTVTRNAKAPLAPKPAKISKPTVANPRNRFSNTIDPGTSGLDVMDLAVTVATVINNTRNAESYTTPTNRSDDDDHRKNSYVSPSIVDSWSSSSTSSSSPSYSSSDSSSSYSSCDTGSSSSSSSCDTGSF